MAGRCACEIAFTPIENLCLKNFECFDEVYKRKGSTSLSAPMSLRPSRRPSCGVAAILGAQWENVGVFQKQLTGTTVCARCAINNLVDSVVVSDDDMDDLNGALRDWDRIPRGSSRQGGGWGIDEIIAAFNGIQVRIQSDTDQPCDPVQVSDPRTANGHRFYAVELYLYGDYSPVRSQINDIIQRDDFVGFILQIGWHWIAVRKTGPTFRLFDSMEQCSESVTPNEAFFKQYSTNAVLVFRTQCGVDAVNAVKATIKHDSKKRPCECEVDLTSDAEEGGSSKRRCVSSSAASSSS